MRTSPHTPAEQIALTRAKLRECRKLCASQARKIARLEAASPSYEAEIEIARLERIAYDLADRWEEAEMEVLRLRRQLRSVA